jgi:hypothetical protein
MKTDPYYQSDTTPVFPQIVSGALTHLKQQLQRDYEQAYPALREIVHLVLDEEEANARNLSSFPHLLFPDLVEAHIANLNLRPAETRHDDVTRSDRVPQLGIYQPAFALCG